MLPKIPHVKPGDVITAEDFNAIAERLERCMNLTVAQGSGLVMSSGPWGKALGLALPHDIWGQLSGSSSPYSFVEVMRTTSNTWATFGHRSGTNNAYEINGKSGLNGKVVQLSWTPAGDWRFVAPCRNCGCNPATTTITFTVYGCFGFGYPISGATVTVTLGGVTVASGTTDGSGQFVANLTQPGTYVWSASYPTLETQTGGVTVTCGNNYAVSATMFAPPTSVCCCNTTAIPQTLYLTVPTLGTVTLSYDSSSQHWLATPTITVTGNSASGACNTTITVHVTFSLNNCNVASPVLAVSWDTAQCPCPGGSWLPSDVIPGEFDTCDCATNFSLPWPNPCAGLATPITFSFPASADPGSCDGGTCPSPLGAGTATLSQ
jgi:hypothetical protein